MDGLDMKCFIDEMFAMLEEIGLWLTRGFALTIGAYVAFLLLQWVAG